MFLSLFVTMSLAVIVYFNASRFVGAFSEDPDVIATGVAMMHAVVGLYFIVCLRECLQGILRGYGHSKATMVLALCGMVLVRQIYLGIAMGRNYVVENIYYCYPVAWSATVIFLSVYFFIQIKRKKVFAPKEVT